MNIPEEKLALLTTKGFDAEFFRNLANSETHQEAYNLTEQQYEETFGKRRYSNFDSYRKSRDRRLKV